MMYTRNGRALLHFLEHGFLVDLNFFTICYLYLDIRVHWKVDQFEAITVGMRGTRHRWAINKCTEKLSQVCTFSFLLSHKCVTYFKIVIIMVIDLWLLEGPLWMQTSKILSILFLTGCFVLQSWMFGAYSISNRQKSQRLSQRIGKPKENVGVAGRG